jgi:WD40 repeat protein
MTRSDSSLAVTVVAMTFLLAGRVLAQKEISAKPPNGDRVASASGKLIQVRDSKSKELVWQVKWTDQSDIQVLIYNPDGKTLASGDKSGHVNLHDAATGALKWVSGTADQRRPSGRGVTVLLFSPDGKLLACAESDGLVSLFLAPEGKLIWRAKTQLQGVYELRFSVDGKEVTAKASEESGGSQTFQAATGKPSR